MDDMSLARRHQAARRQMIDAFREVSDALRHVGVDEEWLTERHGRFFDGNEDAKVVFGTAEILSWLYCNQDPTPL